VLKLWKEQDIFQKSATQHTGWPVLRAMLLEFPDDPACRGVASPSERGAGQRSGLAAGEV
jgi:hypothetical protein